MKSDDTRQCWQKTPSPIKQAYVQQYAQGHTALDLGMGAGFYGRKLQEQGFDVIGLDLMPREPCPYPCVQARLAHLPFKRPFDTVLAFDILEHEPLEEEALHALRRLTGQRLLLSVPNADDRLLTPYNLTFKHHIDKTHQREYFVDELQSKLEEAGFRILVLKKEGAVNPAVLAEFLPGFLRRPFRFLLKGLFELKLLKNNNLIADLYVVAEPDA